MEIAETTTPQFFLKQTSPLFCNWGLKKYEEAEIARLDRMLTK
jgi:hypothetical protein